LVSERSSLGLVVVAPIDRSSAVTAASFSFSSARAAERFGFVPAVVSGRRSISSSHSQWMPWWSFRYLRVFSMRQRLTRCRARKAAERSLS